MKLLDLLENKQAPVDAIKAWTAKGGEHASKFPITTEKLNKLDSWLESAPMVSVKLERGIALSKAKWEQIWERWTTKDSIITFDERSSFTKDVGSGRSLGYSGGEVTIKFTTKGPTKGRDLKGLGIYDQEQEVLVPKNSKFKVLKWDVKNGINYIEISYVR